MKTTERRNENDTEIRKTREAAANTANSTFTGSW